MILGYLDDAEMKTSEGKFILPYRYFLATPLLPCRAIDGGLRKFCGNEELGVPEDHLSMAVHAYIHFSWLLSGSHIFFCDLQGMLST